MLADRSLENHTAICTRGFKGLILKPFPQEVTYPDGTKGLAWVGVHLGPGRTGKPWSSRKPQMVKSLSEDTIRMLKYMVNRALRLRGEPPI
jgi:hypothetical protein